MKKLLMTIVAILALGAFASPTFAGQGEPNDHADGAGEQSAGNAHGENGHADDRAGAGGDNSGDNSGDNAHGGNGHADDRAGAGGDNRGGHGE